MNLVDRLKSSHSLLGDPLHREAWEEIERLRGEPELTPSRYWEAQASMWHENYKDALKYELDHTTFLEALERISSGKWTAERSRQIARRALDNRKVR